MIDRNKAQEILWKHLTTDSLRKHCLGVAVIMEQVAIQKGANAKDWYICGLLHDIDLDIVDNNPELHGNKGAEILADYGIDEKIIHAIRGHADKVPRISELDKWLWICDPLSGLITAAALMRPEKKISAISLKSLKKRFQDKRFAAGANREQIRDCENNGIALEDFLTLARDAMANIEESLGF